MPSVVTPNSHLENGLLPCSETKSFSHDQSRTIMPNKQMINIPSVLVSYPFDNRDDSKRIQRGHRDPIVHQNLEINK